MGRGAWRWTACGVCSRRACATARASRRARPRRGARRRAPAVGAGKWRPASTRPRVDGGGARRVAGANDAQRPSRSSARSKTRHETRRSSGGPPSVSPGLLASPSRWAGSISPSFPRRTGTASAWDSCARPAALAGLAEARGRLEEAGELYRRAAERWAEFGSVVEQAYALLGLGRCGNARASLEGEDIFASLGASPVLARAA